jgi:hypothetical protein
MANEGPSLTKKKRTKRPAPCPEQRKADQAVSAIFAAISRAFDEKYKKEGLAEALGIPEPPAPPKQTSGRRY